MNAPLNCFAHPCLNPRSSRVPSGRHGVGCLLLVMVLVLGVTRAEAAPPDNDDFANAEEISGYAGSIGGSTVDASKELGEPNHGANPGANSIWYVWQAPASGTAEFNTFTSSFDTTMGVYTGTDVASLTSRGQSDDTYDYFPFAASYLPTPSFLPSYARQGRVRFTAQAGTVYYIAVDGYFESTPVAGDVVLNWDLQPAPANDKFANALVLTGDTGFLVVENAGATKETGEPNHAGNSGGASLWFRWTPGVSGTARIYTVNSWTDVPQDMDTLLAVYTGASVNTLTQVAANDNINANTVFSLANFTVSSGTTYWIAVDGKNTGSGAVNGKIALAWTVGIPAANNSFAGAKVLTGKCGLVKGNTFSATKEAGEPLHADDVGGASVWFSWTAPEDGPTTFSSVGSPFRDTLMAVYTGNAVNSLVLVAANDDLSTDSQLYFSVVTFEATAGTTYRIALDGYRGTGTTANQGIYFLSWGNAAPANDEFFAAEVLTGASGSVSGCNYNATAELGEPTHVGGAGHSVWYQWSPPAAGLATISLESSLYDTVVAVYTGDDLQALTLVADNDDIGTTKWQSRVRFPVDAGVTYLIAVDTLPLAFSVLVPFDGPLQLDYSLSAPPVLEITRGSGNVTVKWAGPYRLQTTSALANPSAATVWTDLPGFSPMTLPSGSQSQFFRAIAP